MSTPGVRSVIHLDVFIDAIEQALAPVEAYRRSEVPTILPNRFAVIDIERRSQDVDQTSARATSSGWSVSAECSANTTTEAGRLSDLVALALEGRRFEVSDRRSTPLRFDSADAVRTDDDRYVSLITFTYVI